MAGRKWNLNTIYISERLQECLRPISRCALTTVVAPMGYGKTTAVNWYLAQRQREGAGIIRISVYSDNLAIFWKSVQEAFARAGLDFVRGCDCPTDTAAAGLLAEDLSRALAGEKEWFLFLDDFHLLTDSRVPGFLCILAGQLPGNVHLVVASRDRFLPPAEAVRLGGRLYQVGTEQLRLNHTELAIYAHRCGTDLSDGQIERLLYSSEGWFSAVYLNLCTLSERGELPDRGSDIYAMFTAAMIDPLPPKQREFLAVMGMADEFTVEMARFVTGNKRADSLLGALTGRNAFVTRLPDGVTFRFHHMMKDCAEGVFAALKPERQRLFRERYGAWYEEKEQYLHALAAYEAAGDFTALLRVVQKDAGILLASVDPERVLDRLGRCPVSVLKENPQALLVLMRSMFNWRRIPKMLELKGLLLASIEEHPDMPEEERGNLLGECDLIMSFLEYNDISAMSRLHRSASARMSRPAVSIRSSGGWTFGSPSVLMMFHRGPGALDGELAEMDECMPHYYKVTNGHGQGAEKIMAGEAALLRGNFSDAHIALESACAQIRDNGQQNMALCCDFLARRLYLCADIPPRRSFEQWRQELLQQHNAAWMNIFNSICAYYYALLGETERIPVVFRQHRLDTINFLAPGKPMMEMVENQVYLAQGEWAAVIGRSQGLLAVCQGMHYALVALHVRIQTAAALVMLGKEEQAAALLDQALADAAPDGLILPFAENSRWLLPLLERCRRDEFTRRVLELSAQWQARRALLTHEAAQPAAFAALTAREREIAALAAGRLSNREIGEKLFLSEGSVKQYVSQIYAKLNLTGETRDKRAQLARLLEQQ